jgi:glutaredoxin 3
MTSVEIYTQKYCSFCQWAKELLTRKGVDFREIDVTADRQMREEMVARANGRTTVPQIFVGPTHIGGCDELYALEEGGGLDVLLGPAEGKPA